MTVGSAITGVAPDSSHRKARRGPGLLNGQTVAIWGDRASVRYAGWLLAGLGATVHHHTDAVGDTPVDLFLRRGVTQLPLAQVVPADVVITTESASPCDAGAPSTATRVVVEAWGSGAYENLPADDRLYGAVSGVSSFTQSRAGEPVHGFGRRLQYIAGAFAATYGVSALVARRLGHRAADVVVNELEACVAVLPYATTQYAYNGSSETSEQSGPRFVVATADGFVVVYSGGAWAAQAALIGDDALVDDGRFVTMSARFEHGTELGRRYQDWCRDMTTAEVMRRAREHSVAVSPVHDLTAVLDDSQLAHLGGLEDVELADGRTARMPVLPVMRTDDE